MFEDVSPAPSPVSTSSPFLDAFNKVVGAAGDRVSQELTRQNASDTFSNGGADLYGVNQDGRIFAAGVPTFSSSGQIFGVPAPLVLVGVGILALAFILHGKGR